MSIGELPSSDELTKLPITIQMKLAPFYAAQRPHDAVMSRKQLNDEFGKPDPKVSDLNMKRVQSTLNGEYGLTNNKRKWIGSTYYPNGM